MRILQLCLKPPYPKIDGGCIAMSNLAEGLINAGHEVDILAIATHKHPFQLEDFPLAITSQGKVEAVFVNTKINLVDAFSALITADSYNVSRFFSSDLDYMLIRWLAEKNYDVIQLESLFMTPYIPSIRKLSQAKLVLRSHNLEHLIWERLANTASRSPKKLYLKHLATRLKKYEVHIINEVDGIASISRKDTENFKKLACKKPLKTIPFGINFSQTHFIKKVTQKPLHFFHLGAMNWQPNVEAVEYILQEIWPLIKNLDIRLSLAGKDMPEDLFSYEASNLSIEGLVPSASEFMENKDVMIVPLLSGSGIRIKIIEGMALGKVIITTTIGAEGIDYTNNKDIIIANTPKEFKQAIEMLCNSPEKVDEIGQNARNLIQKEHNNESAVEELIRFYNELK